MIPSEDFDTVAASRREGKEVAAKDIHTHLGDDAPQLVEAGAHVNGLCGDKNANAARQR